MPCTSAPSRPLGSTRHLAALALLAAAGAASAQTTVQVDAGVGVTIRQPGVYGRIEFGTAPPPPVVYPQPVIIVPGPIVVRRPIYLYVPPGHARDWGKHCSKYQACGQPVYFVQPQWVESRWAEHEHDEGKGRGRGRSHDDDRGKGRGRDKD